MPARRPFAAVPTALLAAVWLVVPFPAVFAQENHEPDKPKEEPAEKPEKPAEKPAVAVESFRCSLPPAPLYITVPAKVGDKDALFVFDTCAAVTALDVSLRRVALREVENSNSQDPKKPTPRLFELPAIAVDSFVVPHATGTFIDTQLLQQFVGEPVAGVLGISDMGDAKVLLDYQQGVLELHRGPWKLADVPEVDFVFEHGAPKFEDTLEGHQASFFIDSGLNGCLGLEAPLFDQLVSEGVIELSPQSGRNAAPDGVSPHKQGWFLKGKLMGRDLTGVSVAVSSGKNMLGLGWLCAFQCELDVTAHKVRFRNLPEARPPLEMSLTLGAIIIFRNGRAAFEGFQPGARGLLERAGVLPTEVIEDFGDLATHKINARTLTEAVAANAGKKVQLKLFNPAEFTRREVTIEIPATPVSSWNFAGREKPEEK